MISVSRQHLGQSLQVLPLHNAARWVEGKGSTSALSWG